MNEYYNIDDLPFEVTDKEKVLEYLAHQLYSIIIKFNDYYEHHKSYDPLTIEDNIAHSYTFDLENGGRHHKIKSLEWLEKTMVAETESIIRKTLAEEILRILDKRKDISMKIKKQLAETILEKMSVSKEETSFYWIFPIELGTKLLFDKKQ